MDGHVTEATRLGLLVLVADCYPVALSDGAPGGDVALRLASAGRRDHREGGGGFDGAPARRSGPGIGGCCYEVGPEVLEAFAGLERVADGRMLDLRAVIDRKLAAAGVTQVHHLDHCTSCRPDLYFSHRRDRGLTGRQAGLAVLDGS